MGLALDNLQGLICHKTQPTNQIPDITETTMKCYLESFTRS